MTWSTPDVYTVGQVLTNTSMNKISTDLNAGMGAIGDTTLGGSAATISFTSIPSTFAHLMLEMYLRCDDAATLVGVNIRFNGDSANNYDYQYASASAAAAVAAEGLTQSAGQCGLAPAASAGANLFSAAYLLIPHYAAALNNKAWKYQTVTKSGTASGNMTSREGGGFWRSNAAINQITLLDNSGGNFISGSRATLYGMGS